jgi:hypothetical protein
MRTSRRRTSRASVTIRRGSITAPGFKATAYRGGNAAFRGRIAVERGSGMVEFPSVAQLPRILREEGIASSAAEKAFGRGRLRANGGGGVVVRQGYLKVGDTEASEYVGSEKRLAGKIHITGPGIDTYKSPAEFARIAEKLGVDTNDVLQAFRHLIQTAKLSEATDEGKLTFALRRMKLAHIGPQGIAPGTKRGSLVLFDTRTGTPVWGVIEEPPGTLRNMATNRSLTLDSVFTKAKELKIPAQAVYDAFGHLMSAVDKKMLLATFHGAKVARNGRGISWGGSVVKAVARGDRRRRKLQAARVKKWLRKYGLRRVPREGLIG